MKFIPATDRYIARLVFVPLIGTLVIASMLLLLEKMLRLFDFVATEGGPVSVVWRMLANLIPEYMSLGIPIGLLLGILLAFRRLATTSELDIFRAVGQGYLRLLRMPYVFAVTLALLNLGIVGFLQPVSRYLYEELRFELRSGALGASIKVGEFNNLGKNLTMRVDQSRNDGKSLTGMFVSAKSNNGQSIAVTAARGQFLRTDDPDTIILRLQDGTLIHDAPNYKNPRVLTFSNHDVPIPLPKIESFRGRGGSLDDNRELKIHELWQVGTNAKLPIERRNGAMANFHFRLVEVAMMLLLPLLALALAVPPKRSTSALGVFLSIIMVVTYHKVNEYAEDVGALGVIDPALALWVPFLFFAALILWMYHVIAHVPGGQPIGALEVVAAKTGKRLRKLLRFGRKRKLAGAEG
ncbi:LPS export ABC transporter permease LptF [Sphingorhabdus arenilitoris]|uniref:LPS export ABC transporter permease LptF n=1 Tax=Sphingorhabdus arenilitoris TaxID=1490041 RepID=A0ABV8RL03_9SPHN